MSETTHEQEVDAHNARQLVDEIVTRLEVMRHEGDLIAGLLSDLCIYLPHHPIKSAALNPDHRNDGFVRA